MLDLAGITALEETMWRKQIKYAASVYGKAILDIAEKIMPEVVGEEAELRWVL